MLRRQIIADTSPTSPTCPLCFKRANGPGGSRSDGAEARKRLPGYRIGRPHGLGHAAAVAAA